MDIGTTLRGARQQQGLTMRELAEVTKIPAALLERIERNDFNRVPGGLFTRAYLREYARQVGLDAETIVREYRAQVEPTQPHSKFEPPPHRLGDNEAHGRLWIVGAAALILAYVFYPSLQRPNATPARVLLAAAPAPTITESIDRTDPAEAPPSRRVRLELEPHGPCWIAASTDGNRVVYRLMQPGERQAVEAREEIVLRVGDAGALDYRINGATGVTLGLPGKSVTVRITNDNYQSFVAVDGPTDRDQGAT